MPPPPEESQLRWPLERPIAALSILVNLGLVIAAILLVTYGAEWLETHPVLAKRIGALRLVAIAAIVGFPGIVVLRNARRGAVRGNAIRLSRDQIPEIYELLERQCRRLDIAEIPELYLSDMADESQAFSAWNRDYIVLGTDHLGPLQESRDTIEFFLGRQVGALRLRHAKWWNELLLWYVLKLPGVKFPVQQARVLSLDRYGAFLAGGALKPLVLLGAGRHLSRSVNAEEYLEYVSELGGFWARVGGWGAGNPPLAKRVMALQEAGLLRQDTEGWGSPVESNATREER